MGSIERFAFYDLAKNAYCVIQTGERRFYGCFVFKKGVIAPDAYPATHEANGSPRVLGTSCSPASAR